MGYVLTGEEDGTKKWNHHKRRAAHNTIGA
jgi:hypothetical protein